MQNKNAPVIPTRIARAIETLGPEQRLFFQRKYVCNMGIEQTCSEMKITSERYAALHEECLRALRKAEPEPVLFAAN